MTEFVIYDSNPIHNTDFDDPVMRDIYGWENEHLEMYDAWGDLTDQLSSIPGNWLVVGTLGLWDGPRKVWVTGKCLDLIRRCVNNMDEVQITENSRGKVSIICQHHDGTNTFELRQLPYSGNFGTVKQMRKHSTNAHLRKAMGWI